MTIVQELIVDAYGCQGDLSDPKRFTKPLVDAIASVGASIVDTIHHRFVPHGLTMVAILKESHFILSTWPEHELVIVNIFLCNEKMNAKKCWEVLALELQPKQIVIHAVPHRIYGTVQKKIA